MLTSNSTHQGSGRFVVKYAAVSLIFIKILHLLLSIAAPEMFDTQKNQKVPSQIWSLVMA